jgi:hypothetical protein
MAISVEPNFWGNSKMSEKNERKEERKKEREKDNTSWG